jgi:hypothetical protein
MKEFADDLNTAVITTKYVLEGKSPILFIFHYDDGSWQFSGPEENLLDEDYRVLSLDEIIRMDSSVLEVADLPYEGEAYRETKRSQWNMKSQSEFG